MVLTAKEKLIVKGKGACSGENSMLTDVHMFEFNQIMCAQTIYQMQSTLLLQHPNQIVPVPIEMDFIQILFSGNAHRGHWITIFKRNTQIHIFDTAGNKTLKDEHKIYISYLFPYHAFCQMTFEKIQLQTNAFDCGVFAIANAISLANNICPCYLEYDIPQMRSHLLKIFDENRFIMFPTMKNYCNINENFESDANMQQQSMIHRFPLNYEPLLLDNATIQILFNEMKNRLAQEQKKLMTVMGKQHDINMQCCEMTIEDDIIGMTTELGYVQCDDMEIDNNIQEMSIEPIEDNITDPKDIVMAVLEDIETIELTNVGNNIQTNRIRDAARKKRERESLKENDKKLDEHRTKEAERKKKARQSLKQNIDELLEHRSKEAARKKKERQSLEVNNQKLYEHRGNEADRKKKERQSLELDNKKLGEYRTKDASRKQKQRQILEKDILKLKEYHIKEGKR